MPVLLKEVGSGLSRRTAGKIGELPVAGVETAGVGGTSWSKVESLRAAEPARRSLGEALRALGDPDPRRASSPAVPRSETGW